MLASPPSLKLPDVLEVTGTGLITGLPVTLQIDCGPADSGIVFQLDDETFLPAQLAAVVHTDRGVTLGHPSQKTLSIVEHFLSACCMANITDMVVKVNKHEQSPIWELPLLDGSAEQWVDVLTRFFKPDPLQYEYVLKEKAVTYRHDEQSSLYAIPSESFQVTYALDYPDHPDIHQRFVRWNLDEDGLAVLAAARTWGFLKELPDLQAKGLARGVSLSNTLGLTDEGGYTTPLRMPEEPLIHKILDLVGDIRLSGINPLTTKAHIFVINGGHGSHIPFAKKFINALSHIEH